MRPLKRYGSSKKSGARRFARDSGRTKSPNIAATPMRGGFRL